MSYIGSGCGTCADAVITWQLHPWCQQKEAVRFCEQNGIVLQAYCPIVRNQKAENPTLVSVAGKHGVSPNQVLIRWSLQRGWVCLPKSDDPDRIRANASVYHFNLDAQDMAELNELDEGRKGAIVMPVSSTQLVRGRWDYYDNGVPRLI